MHDSGNFGRHTRLLPTNTSISTKHNSPLRVADAFVAELVATCSKFIQVSGSCWASHFQGKELLNSFNAADACGPALDWREGTRLDCTEAIHVDTVSRTVARQAFIFKEHMAYASARLMKVMATVSSNLSGDIR